MDFQSGKSFGKLRHRAFQPYHQILYLLKHVEEVEDRSSTPMGCNAIHVGDVKDCKYLQYTQNWMKTMVEQPCVSAFQNFFRIENLFNIKEVMSKNMFVYILSFF